MPVLLSFQTMFMNVTEPFVGMKVQFVTCCRAAISIYAYRFVNSNNNNKKKVQSMRQSIELKPLGH